MLLLAQAKECQQYTRYCRGFKLIKSYKVALNENLPYHFFSLLQSVVIHLRIICIN